MSRQFSESQKQSINHNTGPCLVLAGPGSGKTLVITNRTKALIETYGVNPSNILVITFTKAAAKEMKERFDQLMGESTQSVTFGTFHAVFFKILKFAYNYNVDNILREEEKFRMIRELVEREQLDIEDMNDFVSSIASEISSIKGDMVDVRHYYSNTCSEDIFRKVYNAYEQWLRRNNKVDFDDMLVMCYELLKARSDILSAWQKKYQYILIDEFQDINRVQYEIMKMLALPKNNLFIVGDDDQSIYRFRGARPEIMLNFEKEYPDAKRYILNQNYRSQGKIVQAAMRVIKHNRNRFDKPIKPTREDGMPVQCQTFRDMEAENQYIIECIQKMIAGGKNYSDIAVLFRTNIGPRFLVDKLMEYNVPFHMKDSMPNIYNHFIAQNFISYIRIACGEGKREDYLNVVNRPNRYISRDAMSTDLLSVGTLKEYYQDKDWMVERLEKMEYDLSMLAHMSPYAAITYICKAIDYENYLVSYAKFRKMNPDDLLDICNELAEAAKPYQTYEEWFQHIEDYGEELLQQTRKNQMQSNAVELATMHSSKGLEYDTVFIIDAVEGVTPHNKALLDEDMEEERRLFYVGMTRAKNQLYIFSTQERFRKPVEQSRFVGEILYDSNEIPTGQKIIHKKYGEGTIRRIEDEKAVIFIHKTKKELVFDLKYALSSGIITIKY